MAFNVAFRDKYLEQLETNQNYTAGYDRAIVKAFRKRMQTIRAATDERDLYALRSLNFERLKGDRKNQYSMRLNDQWRLIVELEGEGSDKNMSVVAIEDYH